MYNWKKKNNTYIIAIIHIDLIYWFTSFWCYAFLTLCVRPFRFFIYICLPWYFIYTCFYLIASRFFGLVVRRLLWRREVPGSNPGRTDDFFNFSLLSYCLFFIDLWMLVDIIFFPSVLTHAHTHGRTHGRTHRRTHIHTRTRTHTHTNTHTHTHTIKHTITLSLFSVHPFIDLTTPYVQCSLKSQKTR